MPTETEIQQVQTTSEASEGPSSEICTLRLEPGPDAESRASLPAQFLAPWTCATPSSIPCLSVSGHRTNSGILNQLRKVSLFGTG